jgi:FkbM family methyltransferase
MTMIRHIKKILRSPYNSLINLLFKVFPYAQKKIDLLGKPFYYSRFSQQTRNFLHRFKNETVNDIKIECISINHIFDNNPITCIDIGANIGYQSRAYKEFLNLDNHLCFEPSKLNYSFLKKNLKDRTSLYNFALGDKSEIKTLSMPESGNRISNLGLLTLTTPAAVSANFLTERVECIPFDDCKIITGDQKNIFCKIDVEGFELNVLQGMRRFLSGGKNILLNLELNINIPNVNIENIKEILVFLEKINFKYISTPGSDHLNLDWVETSFSDLHNKVKERKIVDAYFIKNSV